MSLSYSYIFCCDKTGAIITEIKKAVILVTINWPKKFLSNPIASRNPIIPEVIIKIEIQYFKFICCFAEIVIGNR